MTSRLTAITLLTHEELASLSEFEKWLKSKNPKEVVGTACTRHDCPLARRIQENYPTESVTVDKEGFNIEGKQVPHSSLSDAFVTWLDDEFNGERCRVTARKALLVLQGARRYCDELIQRKI
ncbi:MULTISPECIES: hypothetical protein [Trichocoleus]|uniref:Uncharacterized protein n=1 Tax=Trichocoleus desertorum GB2-A4 TaxID=2933944 RepID=A0ABV0JCY6_9CYAN|nr:hypothetical protein [Trichocoleus sp. FACHB-46]MBD1864289.1 hypothetical protein [Trichocoleus sp. FACHB-46]